MPSHIHVALQHLAAGSCVFPAPAATYTGETCLQRQFGSSASDVSLLIMIVMALIVLGLGWAFIKRVLFS